MNLPVIYGADGRPLNRVAPDGVDRLASLALPRWASFETSLGAEQVGHQDVYRGQASLAGVIDKLARRIATLPFDAYRRLSDNGREMIARSDSLATLITRPMPRQATVHLLTSIMQSLLIHGNAIVMVLPDPANQDGPPIGLWPLDWARVSAYARPGHPIEWWGTTQFDDGRERVLPAAATMLFAWPGPAGSEVGVSPLEKLAGTLRLEDSAQRHQEAMFKNGVRPSLAVTVESGGRQISTDQLEFARTRTEAMHKGVDYAGKTFFMGSDVKLQPLSMSPVEVALIEQRTINLAEIGRVFDLSGPVMNDLTHGTYSNVQVLLDALYRDVVPPWLTLIEQTFQVQLIDTVPGWLDLFVAFDLTDKLKGDPAQLAMSLKTQVEAGIITRNEARRILNLPPVDEDQANRLTAQVNNQGLVGDMGATSLPAERPA